MKKTKLFILACVIILTCLNCQGFGSSPYSRPNPFEVFGLIMWLTSGISFTAAGLFLILFGHMSVVLREIAINTRKEAEKNDPYKKKEEYSAILSIVPILKIIGVIIIIAGWAWPLLSKLQS